MLNTKKESSVSFEPKTSEELRQFFVINEKVCHEIWVILTKKEYANPQPVSFEQAVVEAVKLGLIDSRTKSVSDQKYAIRFTKRKPKV